VSIPLGHLLVLRAGPDGFVNSGGLNGFCQGSNRIVIPRWVGGSTACVARRGPIPGAQELVGREKGWGFVARRLALFSDSATDADTIGVGRMNGL